VSDQSPASAATLAYPASGLLSGRRLVVTGVMTPKSIAFSIAQAAQAAGAEVLLTSVGRVVSITEKSARRLDPVPDVLDMDATAPDQVAAVAQECERRWGGVDGVVHAIGFAPENALGGRFLTTPWESVATAMNVSAFSLKTLAAEFAPLMADSPCGGSVVTLTFDGSLAWPLYDWMGPTKAALEAIVRYLARDLGPQGTRVNAISAGPLETMAAKSIPGFKGLKDIWSERAPLSWDCTDASPVGDVAVFLLSPLARAVTGSVIHVDGGYHALGAPLVAEEKE
jgi:enoyl ACP reductase